MRVQAWQREKIELNIRLWVGVARAGEVGNSMDLIDIWSRASLPGVGDKAMSVPLVTRLNLNLFDPARAKSPSVLER